MSQEQTPISSILMQWKREIPDLNASPMAVCGQVWRTAEILRKTVQENHARYGMDSARSDVIFALRRQGKGKKLSPSQLAHEMMLSTSAMTNRLDRLEKDQLIKRHANPDDRRGLKISLTQKGFELANKMVVTHVKTQDKMLQNLDDTEQQTLMNLLGKIA